jgi:hypothetical protein
MVRASPTGTRPVDWRGLGAWAKHSLLNDNANSLRSTTSDSKAAYGDYYRVARAFVRLISEPKVMHGLSQCRVCAFPRSCASCSRSWRT